MFVPLPHCKIFVIHSFTILHRLAQLYFMRIVLDLEGSHN